MTVVSIVYSADVAIGVVVPESTRVWDLAQVRENAILGEGVIIGRGVYIGAGVQIGDNSKIQNYALIYEPALLEQGVFVGPAAVLTNDRLPRAVNPDGSQKSTGDWKPEGVHVGQGASIGARAVCVAPAKIGAWAMVAAGAVVTRDVPAFALVAGVPARQVGWVGRSGARLEPVTAEASMFTCPDTGAQFLERNGVLTEVNS